MSLQDLKRNKNRLSALVSKAQEEKSGGKKDRDARFWTPTVDDSNNGNAIIRFLPEPAGEDFPWVKMFKHAFQEKGGWYIENCLTTIGEDDPVNDLVRRLYNTKIDSDKELAGKLKRTLSHISNILVVKDDAKPENNGKVFLFAYGKMIFDMLVEAMKPELEDDEPVDPFDMWKGANFRLRIRDKAGYRNYEKSKFDSPSAIADSDEEIEKIYKQCHPLKPFLEVTNFKSKEELTKRLLKVVGTKIGTVTTLEGASEEPEQAAPTRPISEAPKQKIAETKPASDEKDAPWNEKEVADVADTKPDADDDEMLSMFESLK